MRLASMTAAVNRAETLAALLANSCERASAVGVTRGTVGTASVGGDTLRAVLVATMAAWLVA
jgi:hypothetical protein